VHDEARSVVIYSLNANIHVYVHQDLNEIYLCNVKWTLCPVCVDVPLPDSIPEQLDHSLVCY
jgi:hypothetical protein